MKTKDQLEYVCQGRIIYCGLIKGYMYAEQCDYWGDRVEEEYSDICHFCSHATDNE